MHNNHFTRFRFAVLCALFFTVYAPSPANGQNTSSTAATKDWPRFLGSNIDGVSVETGISKDWSNGKLKLNWQIDLGEGYSMCSIAGGLVYQFDKFDGRGRLRAVDIETGDTQWKFDYKSDYRDLYGYDAGPRSSPLVDGVGKSKGTQLID